MRSSALAVLLRHANRDIAFDDDVCMRERAAAVFVDHDFAGALDA